jgi:O-antigen/teichoic acid export membrane protein
MPASMSLKSEVGKSRLTVDGLISITSQLMWGLQGFITFVMAGRMLPRNEFGFVVAANTILYGSQCLLLGPITNPTLRFGAISRRSLRVAYSAYCLITLFVSAIFVLFDKQLGGLIFDDPAFIHLFRILGVPFAATSLYGVQKLVLFARERYKTVLIMDALFTASNIAALLVLNARGLLFTAVGFYLARSCAAVIGLLPALSLLVLTTRPDFSQNEAHFEYKEYFRHSKYSFVSMLSGYGQGQVDTLAVAHFLSPLSAATYGAAKVFFTGLTMVTTGLVMVALPASSRIAASGKETLSRYYRRAVLLAYAFLLPGGAILALLAGPIVHACFHGRYADAVPIVRLFCLASLVMPLSSITDAVANGAGWFRSACLASVIGGGIGIALSISLTRSFGLPGAALATILALSSSAGVIVWRTWCRMGVDRTSLESATPSAMPVSAND